MKVTLEIDTDANPGKLELIAKAEDMAQALHDLADAVREWYKYPDDNPPLTADSLREKFYDILAEYTINLDRI